MLSSHRNTARFSVSLSFGPIIVHFPVFRQLEHGSATVSLWLDNFFLSCGVFLFDFLWMRLYPAFEGENRVGLLDAHIRLYHLHFSLAYSYHS